MARITRATSIVVGKTFGANKTISGITQANPPVVTSTAHGYSNGDLVVLNSDVAGMTLLAGQACRIAGVTTDTFQLEGMDTSDTAKYPAFTSGTCKKVTAFDSMGDAQGFEMNQDQAQTIDVTTVFDTEEQSQPGRAGKITISVPNFFNPTSAAMATLRARAQAQIDTPLKVVFDNGNVMVINTNVAVGQGFNLQTNQAAVNTVQFSAVRSPVYYAS